MIARTRVVVGDAGRLDRLSAEPPLTVRRVYDERRDTCALCLVGTAAGPLPGDDLALELHLRPRARATLSAAGASIAQGSGAQGSGAQGSGAQGSGDHGARSGPDHSSRLAMDVRLDDGAGLDADPGPLIVCAGARVDVAVSITLSASATVVWRELIVLGRTGAPAGAATLRWDVTRDGQPVLRQFVDLTDPRLTSWPGLIAGRRVLASAFVCGPRIDARLVVAAPTAIAQPLDEHAVLITVLAADAATALAQLDGLLRLVSTVAATMASVPASR